MADKKTVISSDSLAETEVAFAQAEELVDKATNSVIECSHHTSKDILDIQQTISNLHSVVVDHIDAKIGSSVARELHKNRIKDCEATQSVLKETRIRQAEFSEARDVHKDTIDYHRESCANSWKDKHEIKSRLIDKEIEWAVAKTTYYNACIQTKLATDHLGSCEYALTQAEVRLNAAKLEEEKAQSELTEIRTGMADLLAEMNTIEHDHDSQYYSLMYRQIDSQYSNFQYLTAEESVHVTQHYINRLEQQNQEYETQIIAKEKATEETLEDFKACKNKIQKLSEKFDKHIEDKRLAKINLRQTEKKYNRASRKRDQIYRHSEDEKLQHEHAVSENTALSKGAVFIFIFLTVLTIAHWSIGLPDFTITANLALVLLGVSIQMAATAIVNLEWSSIRSKIKHRIMSWLTHNTHPK